MFNVHVLKIEPSEGRPVIDLQITYESPTESETTARAVRVGVKELTHAIRQFVDARHMLRSMARDHIDKCDECLLNAVEKSEPK